MQRKHGFRAAIDKDPIRNIIRAHKEATGMNNRISAHFVACEKNEVETHFEYPSTIVLPRRGSSSSAGYDFVCPYSLDFGPHEEKVIPMWVKCLDMPRDKVLKLYVRSSIGIKRGLELSNSTGIIDSDYVWCIFVALRNRRDVPAHIDAGERIVQGIFESFYVTCDDAPIADERTGGIGSTGKK